jgi:dephospho-CoA kinase
VNVLEHPRRYLIGLTGNIATGKSVVLAVLHGLGAHPIDADKVAHQIMTCQEPVKEAIARAFGENVLTHRGDIDRRALGRIVFRDPTALRRLESIVHPVVIQSIADLIEAAEEDVVVVEAIKLFETGMHRDCDAVWVVTSPPEQQLERLVSQRGLSDTEARLQIEAQPAQAEKLARADVIIDNSGNLQDMERQVVTEWNNIKRQLAQCAT